MRLISLSSFLFLLFSLVLTGKSYSQGSSIQLKSNLSFSETAFDLWGYEDEATGKEFALVALRSGLAVVDITDPEQPQLAAITRMPFNKVATDVRVWGQYAYVVTSTGQYGGIVDLNDPYHPFLADSFPNAHTLFIDHNGYMYLECPDLHVYDLKPDPLNPIMVWDHHIEVPDPAQRHETPVRSTCHASFVKNDRLYVFAGGHGTEIFDISDISNPKLLGTVTDSLIRFHHSGWVTEDQKYLYICDELARDTSADVSIWNIEDPSEPVRVGEYRDETPWVNVHNLFIINGVAYTSYYNAGLRIFDVSTGGRMSLIGEYRTDTAIEPGYTFEGAYGVYPYSASGNILVSDMDNGLFIFSANLPALTTVEESAISNESISMDIFPNPVKDHSTIRFTAEEAPRSISLYNQLGNRIKSFEASQTSAEQYTIHWDIHDDAGSRMRVGIYMLKIEGDSYTETRKIVVAY